MRIVLDTYTIVHPKSLLEIKSFVVVYLKRLETRSHKLTSYGQRDAVHTSKLVVVSTFNIQSRNKCNPLPKRKKQTKKILLVTS